jgi:hypothetical protein
VTGERQLAIRREDAHPVVGAGLARAQQERRLRQIGPAGKALHGFRLDPLGVMHHRNRVAEVGHGGENIDLEERAAWHSSSLAPGAAQLAVR